MLFKKGCAFRQITTLLCVFVLLFTGVGSSFAEGADGAAATPAAAREVYTVNGITYYNVHSEHFDNPAYFLTDMLGTGTEASGNLSMADEWLRLGIGFYHSKGIDSDAISGSADDVLTFMEEGLTAEGRKLEAYGRTARSTGPIYATSLNQAINKLCVETGGSTTDLVSGQSLRESMPVTARNPDKQQDVVAAMDLIYTDSSHMLGVAVFFTDFKAVALLPDASGTNYATTILKEDVKSDRVYASNVKNMTLSPVTAAQSVSTSWASSVTSTVSHSDAYAFSEAIKVGAEADFKVAKISEEVGFTATQTFTDGWTKGAAESKTGTITESVTVALPPYTNVLLEQGSASTVAETKYNCPIGLTYKTLVLLFEVTPASSQPQPYYSVCYVEFGPDARANLYERAIQKGALDLEQETDDRGLDVRWTRVLAKSGPAAAVDHIVTRVPMSPVGATFTETLDTTFTNVKSIVPLEPLRIVRILPPNLTFIGSEQVSYGTLNYLHAEMETGDFSYANYLELAAENAFGAAYYGFSCRNGRWIVVHPDGAEWTEEDAPVVLSRDEASGYLRYTAVRPGTCYLKYLIDENCYAALDGTDGYTKNKDLLSTAALEIRVTERAEEAEPRGTVRVSGAFTGIVGAAPQSPEEGGLSVEITDFSGKELDLSYVWEKKELDARGILVNDENRISFTAPGTFHIRAVCGELGAASDWYEIRAKASAAVKTEPAALDLTYNTEEQPLVAPGSAEGGTMLYAVGSDDVSGPAKALYQSGIPTAMDAGTYYVWYRVAGDEDHADSGESVCVPVTIAKAGQERPDAPAAAAVTMDSVTLQAEEDCEYARFSPGEEYHWQDSPVFEGLTAGTVNLFCQRRRETGNYLASEPSETVSVMTQLTPGRPEITKEPQDRRLSCTGEAQALVTPGTAENGTLVYALGAEEGGAPAAESYTEAIPVAIDRGAYWVWYKALGVDGSATEPAVLMATIGAGTPTIRFPVTALIATGEMQPLVVDPVVTPADLVKVYYSLGDTENELAGLPKACDPGIYEVYYRIESQTENFVSVPYGDPVRIRICQPDDVLLPDFRVSIEGWTYGDEPSEPEVFGNPFHLPVAFLYKQREEEDSAYAAEVPTTAGVYTVKAMVTSDALAESVAATCDFTIEKRIPVFGEDFVIEPLNPTYNGESQILVSGTVKENSGLALVYSFDGSNWLARDRVPKGMNPGPYNIWYRVTADGNPNYEALDGVGGPIVSRILRPLTVAADSAARLFDGRLLTCSGYTITEGSLPEGYVVSGYVCIGGITQPGEDSSSVRLTISDERGNDVTEEFDIKCVTGRLIVLPQPGFVLPSSLTDVNENAFAGLPAESVDVGEGVRFIGAYAFRDSGLRTLVVRGAETKLDDTALEGCDGVAVYAPAGSAAEHFALANGIPFFELVNP